MKASGVPYYVVIFFPGNVKHMIQHPAVIMRKSFLQLQKSGRIMSLNTQMIRKITEKNIYSLLRSHNWFTARNSPILIFSQKKLLTIKPCLESFWMKKGKRENNNVHQVANI